MAAQKEVKKENVCFVIMPISDTDGYPVGHFKRVYEHLIKPACIKAGFKALRADDVYKTNVIIVDILESILSSEMAICDLSGRNPNVLYELGIRQAFNLPVTLIKDNKTPRIFDIQGIRDIEYDENLRVDIVEQKINELADTIKNTYTSRDKEMKSLIQVLNIKPAEMAGKVEISQETSLILNQLKSLNSKINEIESRVNVGYSFGNYNINPVKINPITHQYIYEPLKQYIYDPQRNEFIFTDLGGARLATEENTNTANKEDEKSNEA